MKRESLLLMASGFSTLLFAGTIKNEKKPNVIYILCDDLGYGDLSCYGQEKFSTPNIDRLSAEGMLFTNHYAGCTVSAPSRASLMTGLHTGHVSIRGNKEITPEGQASIEEEFTLAQLFKSAGYTTGIFGKWGLGAPASDATPTQKGFDQFFGYLCQRQSHTYYPSHLWNNEEKVILLGNKEGARNDLSSDMIQKAALNFIASNRNNPFFAYLTYTLPHAELFSPVDSIYKRFEGKYGAETPSSPGYRVSLTPRADFAAMVTLLDIYVGQVIETLKANGLDKNTLVIFTSDNGPHREGGGDPDFFKGYGPLRGSKRDLTEGGIRVPMIAWMPTQIEAGAVSDLPSAFWDMMPTFAQITHTKLKTSTDGISIYPTLFGKGKQKRHNYLYWEFHELGGRQAIRKGNWKLIKEHVNNPERMTVALYNLKDDLHEDNNLSAKYPRKVKRLEKLMTQGRSPSVSFNFGMKVD